jgi:uncharacterized membrane protein
MSTSCWGILEAIGLAPQCDILDAFSGLPLYDGISTPLSTASSGSGSGAVAPVCNDLGYTQGKQLVASPAEPYIGKVCAGIIENYYVPAPATVNASLAPLLPPFVLQYAMESYLTGIEALIPKYMTSDCLLAQREIMCTLIFLQPYGNDALKEYFGTIYIPSLPERKICTNYYDQCSLLINAAPSLAFDCNGTTAPGVETKLFPTGPQTIASIDLGGGFVVPLISPPYELVNVTASYTPECPYGYGVTPSPAPEHGSLPIDGTACSVGCPLAMYTSGEYDQLYAQGVAGIWVSLGFTCLQVVNLAVLKPQKQNIFLVCFILATFVYNLLQALSVVIVKSRIKSVCADDSTTYSLYNSYAGNEENVTASRICAANSITGLYLSFFYAWILFALSAEIWCRVYWGLKKVDFQRRFYMFGSGLAFLFLALFNTFYDSPDVNQIGPGYFCAWRPKNHDTYTYGTVVPLNTNFGISFLMIAHSIFVCIRTTLSVADSERKPILKIWRSYSMLILFLLLLALVSPISQFYYLTYLNVTQFPTIVAGMNTWANCIFQKFTTSADTSYLDICGMVPPDRISLGESMAFGNITTYLNCVVLFVITLNKEVKAFWWTLFVYVLSWLGIKPLIAAFSANANKYLTAAKESNILNNKNFRQKFRRNSFSKAGTTQVGRGGGGGGFLTRNKGKTESVYTTDSSTSGGDNASGDNNNDGGVFSKMTRVLRASTIVNSLHVLIPPLRLVQLNQVAPQFEEGADDSVSTENMKTPTGEEQKMMNLELDNQMGQIVKVKPVPGEDDNEDNDEDDDEETDVEDDKNMKRDEDYDKLEEGNGYRSPPPTSVSNKNNQRTGEEGSAVIPFRHTNTHQDVALYTVVTEDHHDQLLLQKNGDPFEKV